MEKCEFLSAQWENEDSKRNGCQPVLTFCNHKNNPEDTEGNCREDICPLLARPEKRDNLCL